uniref:ATP synthase complex subunit 8 n=1 Tax=Gebiacantha plantae TaxID=576652 RepID=A0A411ATM4_9EUCA|nr:ATP synthase F0 subunit 8 [Gebiacantha plantae]QAX91353.1 ATP synthase F0 subunit 8 [Gebiacantha plantae]
MPQMEPLMWLNLFFMFLISFSVYFIMNYYVKLPSKISSSSLKIMSPSKDWTW